MATELSVPAGRQAPVDISGPEQVCGEQPPQGARDTAEPCTDAWLPQGNWLLNCGKASPTLLATDPSWDLRRGKVRQVRK